MSLKFFLIKGIVDRFQLGIDGGSVLDLSNGKQKSERPFQVTRYDM